MSDILHNVAITVLMTLNGWMGIHSAPPENGQWKIEQPWHQEGKAFVFEASSDTFIGDCQKHPEWFATFPAVIHGSHVISIDGEPIYQLGDPTFNTMRSFYGAPVLQCSALSKGHKISWKAYSYTQYFARIDFFPKVEKKKTIYNVIAEVLNIVAPGGLYLLAFFTFVVFYRKIPNKLTFASVSSSLFFSNYFLGAAAGFFDIDVSMLAAHRFSDVNVYLGFITFIWALAMQNYVSQRVLKIYLFFASIGIAVLIMAKDGDTAQFGTTIPFGLTVGILIHSGFVATGKIRAHREVRESVLRIVSLASFVVTACNDIFVVTGVYGGYPLLPVGVLGGQLFFALAVNRGILATYEERDYLRANLQNEVQLQTAEIRNKTSQLEHAMTELKTTQAELVQSAKLASLGTLSAGIAHEINNSLNYVNGALNPLEKMIVKSHDQESKQKMGQLIGVMKEGLDLTIEIVKSLRSYTGLNQAKFNDLVLSDVIKSVLTILRNKFRNKITVHVDVDPSIKIYGSVVGLNQVFMNLIANAIDAMEAGGELFISAKVVAGNVNVLVQDTGKGIPQDVLDRIFEPFYTTKDVGKGTGLGLYIVKNEVDKHKGNIKVDSAVGKGTTFTVCLPTGEIKQGAVA